VGLPGLQSSFVSLMAQAFELLSGLR
jgi:hypothetical protein